MQRQRYRLAKKYWKSGSTLQLTVFRSHSAKYNKTLIKICYDVGYRHVYTSVCGVNKSLEVQYIKRNNIYNNISDTTLLRYLNQPLGFRLGAQVRYFGIYIIKKLVGDHCYRSLRNGILRGR